MHHCRLCGKSGVNSKTCPLNKNVKIPIQESIIKNHLLIIMKILIIIC